jgi:hypothetical protein
LLLTLSFLLNISNEYQFAMRYRCVVLKLNKAQVKQLKPIFICAGKAYGHLRLQKTILTLQRLI